MHHPGSPVLITGMHRSGTSVTASLLHEQGVFFGKSESLFSADASNEGGYWEHKRISWVNRRFELSLSLPSLGVDPLPPAWNSFPHTAPLVGALKKEIAKEFAGQPLWGWKDPDNGWFLPFSFRALSELDLLPSVVVCLRHPFEVAQSQFVRSQTPHERTLLSWLRHTLCALDDSRALHRILIPFDRLMADPDAVRRVLASFLGKGDAPLPASELVRPERRHQSSNDLPQLEPFTSMFEAMADVARDPEGFARNEYDDLIHRLRLEFDRITTLLQAPLPPAAIAVRSGSVTSVTHHYPLREWQTVTLGVPEGKDLPVSIQLYTIPGYVWVRSSNWIVNGEKREAKLENGPHAGLFVQDGLQCFQLSAGHDQVRTVSPVSGAATLELEVLYEFSSLIAATHSGVMLQSLGL